MTPELCPVCKKDVKICSFYIPFKTNFLKYKNNYFYKTDKITLIYRKRGSKWGKSSDGINWDYLDPKNNYVHRLYINHLEYAISQL